MTSSSSGSRGVEGNKGKKSSSTSMAPAAAATAKNGTMSSQISNWSVASSSAASFDYQPGQNASSRKSRGGGGVHERSSSVDNLLPAVDEVDSSGGGYEGGG